MSLRPLAMGVVAWLWWSGVAHGADAHDPILDALAALQAANGEIVVGMRPLEAEALTWTMMGKPVAGVRFTAMSPTRMRASLRRSGAACGVWLTHMYDRWNPTFHGDCVPGDTALTLAQRRDAYRGGMLTWDGVTVRSAMGELTAADVALSFGDPITLEVLGERRRRALRAGGILAGVGLAGAYVGPSVAFVGLVMLPFELLFEGDATASLAVMGTGVGITLVGVGLAVAGGTLIAFGGRGRGRVLDFYAPAEVEAGVVRHNERLARQLGIEEVSSRAPARPVEWSLGASPGGMWVRGAF